MERTPPSCNVGVLMVDEGRVDGAVHRTLDDVDPLRWGCFLFGASFLRWSLWHPFRLAMIRQRTMRSSGTAMHILQEAYAAHGIRGLFRGVPLAAGGNAVGETSYIAIFETLRHEGGPIGGWLGIENAMLRDSLAGTSADALNVLIAAPFDVVAARQMSAGFGMTASFVYAGVPRTATAVVREHGVRGLFAGTVPSLMYSPSSALWWCIYEPLKEYLYGAVQPLLNALPQRCPRAAQWAPCWLTSPSDNAALNAGAGVTASIVCTVTCNPLLVVASRMQVGLGWGGGSRKKYAGSTMLWVLRDLWKNEGIGGLCKGIRVNIGLAVAEGLLFSQMYEVTKWLAAR